MEAHQGAGRYEMIEPLFWYRPVCNSEMYEGPIHNNSVGGKMLRDENPGEWFPLYAEAQTQAELNAARALLREVANMGVMIRLCDNDDHILEAKIREYLDACDTLEGKC